MLETVFHDAVVSCLRNDADTHVILADQTTLDMESRVMTLRTECPHYSVSLFELDAAEVGFSETSIADLMLYRIRNLTSNQPTPADRTALGSVYHASAVLQDSMLFIANAQVLDHELYRSLEKVQRALNHSSKGRLRIVLLGNERCVPQLALNSDNVRAIRWLNMLRQPESANHMIEEARFAAQLKQVESVSDDKRLIYFGSLFPSRQS